MHYSRMAIVDIPSLPIDDILEDPNRHEDSESSDIRRPQRLLDSRRQADGELSDSDDEGEGGRRNHKENRDLDTVDITERKFGMGLGIMASSASTNIHSAGPSGHTTAARVLSTSLAGPETMEVDTPPSVVEAEVNVNATQADGVTEPAPMALDEPASASEPSG